MSRIDALISRLNPGGLRFEVLGDVAETVAGLSGKSKADFTDGSDRYVSYKNVFANSAVDQAAPDYVKIEPGERQNRLHEGDVIFTGSSENTEDVGMSSVVLGEPSEPLYLNSFCFAVRFRDPSLFVPDFSKHLFRSDSIRSQIRKASNGVTRINISKDRFMKMRIPIPAPQVQREIAQVLDQFADATTELASLINSEREAREVQHQHYRRVILERENGSSRVVALHEVADLVVGFSFKSSQFSGDVADTALLRGDNIGQGFLKDKDFKRWRRVPGDGLDAFTLEAGDVVLAMDRPWIPAGLKWAQISEGDLPALLVQRVARLRAHRDVLDSRFLGCIISSPAFTEHVLKVQTGNTVPHLSGAQVGAFEFRLPSLSEQMRTVVRLDELDSSGRDLSIGLVAEIHARRAQFEHYRERLLTFQEVEA